jgi:hypothetical protein
MRWTPKQFDAGCWVLVDADGVPWRDATGWPVLFHTRDRARRQARKLNEAAR